MQEFSLFLSEISSNYFNGDRNLVLEIEGGIKYSKINLIFLIYLFVNTSAWTHIYKGPQNGCFRAWTFISKP